MRALVKRIQRPETLLRLLFIAAATLLYAEYLHNYVVIARCSWPELEAAAGGHSGGQEEAVVRAMVVADTHLLGSRNGHWFDKLRREWHMRRSFQAAVLLHAPDVVIFLGDLFDEGKWCSTEEFRAYVVRFSDMFAVPEHTHIIIVPGNHDIGFHYSISRSLSGRFERAFNVSSVGAVEVRGVLFVTLNSMALHGDDCYLCTAAESSIKQLYRELSCSRGDIGPCLSASIKPLLPANLQGAAPRPVLLQHYPLYRVNDAHCSGADAAPDKVKALTFRERWECLSRDASQQLLSSLQPRLVLSGHTHYPCTTLHRHPDTPPLEIQVSVDDIMDATVDDPDYAAEEREYMEQQQRADKLTRLGSSNKPVVIIPEVTVSSFSWRNNKKPSFAMVTLTRSRHSVYKCEMAREVTVMYIYISAGVLFLLSLFRRKFWWLEPVYRALY
uniref:Metallophosphoesterase 1-like n=2 Tax=Hirondellea gigas TaxID=1518452 RepID=A0A6A7G2E9_9CRUS